MTQFQQYADDHREEPVVIRDKRRIDLDGSIRRPADATKENNVTDNAGQPTDVHEEPTPSTGDTDHAEAQQAADTDTSGTNASTDIPQGTDEPTSIGDADGSAGESDLAAERLEDLQRLQAEFANYRKRVQRDKEAAEAQGKTAVLEAMMPALDDMYYADAHGELAGTPFAAIAEKLETSLAKLGMERYGAEGDVFDPNLHEALMNQEADDVDVATVHMVMQPGYRMGERVLRPARVGVKSPA